MLSLLMAGPWFAASAPDSPTGWITQAGLGTALILAVFGLRYFVKKLEASEDRVFEMVRTVLPVLTKVEENMRTQAEIDRSNIESTNRHTAAIEALTEQLRHWERQR